MGTNGSADLAVRQRRRLHGRRGAQLGAGRRGARTARSSPSAPMTTFARLVGSRHRGRRPRRADARCPASRTRTCTRVGGGLDMLQCDLHDARRRWTTYERSIAAYAAAHPDAPWILGGGWSMDVFPGGTPTEGGVLDALVPDRPAFLPNRDGHSAWVNSTALELAGITRDTPDPRRRPDRARRRRRAVRARCTRGR